MKELGEITITGADEGGVEVSMSEETKAQLVELATKSLQSKSILVTDESIEAEIEIILTKALENMYEVKSKEEKE